MSRENQPAAPQDKPAPVLPEAPIILTDPQMALMRGATLSGPRSGGFVANRLRRKKWVYVGAYAHDVVVAAAVVNVGYASNAFAFIAPLDGTEPVQWDTVSTPNSARVGRASAQWRSRDARIDIALPTSDMPGYLRAEIARRDKSISIDLQTRVSMGAPITSISPARGLWTLTIKDCGLHATGRAEATGLGTFDVDCGAALDVNDLYSLRHTFWNWSSCSGKSVDGTPIGLNLVRDNNEGPQERENVLWVRGEPLPLGVVTYEYNADNLLAPWRIHGGGVDLMFEPVGQYSGDTNLGLVASKFSQLYGKYTGTVYSERADIEVKLESVTGVAEEHDALW